MSFWCCLLSRAGFEPKTSLDGLWPQALVDSLSVCSKTHSFKHMLRGILQPTPWYQQKMTDGRVASGGLTALFTRRVSRFPGRSDVLQLLDWVQGSGSCIHQPNRDSKSSSRVYCGVLSHFLHPSTFWTRLVLFRVVGGLEPVVIKTRGRIPFLKLLCVVMFYVL